MKRRDWIRIFAASAIGLAGAAAGHPGGLDGKGCHTERKTGQYHCHRAPAPSRELEGARAAGDGTVKLSKSGICHVPSSPYYAQTKSFTAFDSLDACLRAGGRLPKN